MYKRQSSSSEVGQRNVYKILFDKITELTTAPLNNEYCYRFKIVYKNSLGDSLATSSYLNNNVYDPITCPFYLKTAAKPIKKLRYFVKDGQFKDPSLQSDIKLGITLQNADTFFHNQLCSSDFQNLSVPIYYDSDYTNTEVIVPPFGVCPSNVSIDSIRNGNAEPKSISITDLSNITNDSIQRVSFKFNNKDTTNTDASFMVQGDNNIQLTSNDASNITLNASDLSNLSIDGIYSIISNITNIANLSNDDVPLVQITSDKTNSFYYTRKTPLPIQPQINVEYTDCGYGKILKFDISAQNDINAGIVDAAPMGGLDRIKGAWTGGPEYELSGVQLNALSSDGHNVLIDIPIDNIYKNASGEYDTLYDNQHNQYNNNLVTFSMRIDPTDYPLWLQSDKTYEISMNMLFESTINKLGAITERKTITNIPLSIAYETSKKPIDISYVFVPFDKQYIINEDRTNDNVADRNRLALSFYSDNNSLWNGGSRWYYSEASANSEGAVGWNKQTYTASRAFNFKTDLIVSISGEVIEGNANRYQFFRSTNTVNDVSNNGPISFGRQNVSSLFNNNGFIDLSNSWYTLTIRDLVDGENFKPKQKMDVGLRLKYTDICGVEIKNNVLSSNVTPLTQDSSVNVVNFKYTFNDDTSYDPNRRYGLGIGTYTITGISTHHKMALISDSSNITVTTTGGDLSGDLTYYTGDIQINVTGNFGTASVKCLSHLGMQQEMFTYIHSTPMSAKTSEVPLATAYENIYNYIHCLLYTSPSPRD